MKKNTLRFLLLVLLTIGVSPAVFAEKAIATVDSSTTNKDTSVNINGDSIITGDMILPNDELHRAPKGFNAGEMIMEHVQDSHSWHLWGEGHSSMAIPLPVIIYNTTQGKLDVFMSSNFHHGLQPHDGYKLQHNHIVAENGDSLLDFSITKNVAALLFGVIIISWIFISAAKRYSTHKNQAPKGLQSLVEPLILFVRDDIAKPNIGAKTDKFLPYLLTLFFFIFINNLLGLIPIPPGGANLTGNITVTLVLALLTLVIQVANSNKDFWVHIFNTPGVPLWLKLPIPLMPIIELAGFIIKPVVLTLRLFANITAGHIIALAFISLIFIFKNTFGDIGGYGIATVSVPFVVAMSLLECLVAFLQAYVFTLLTSIYIGAAMEEHHHEEAHH